MNGNLTEIVFILDRSGSMAGLEDDTIGGFNAMVEKQKKEQGEAVLSAVLFSNDCCSAMTIPSFMTGRIFGRWSR